MASLSQSERERFSGALHRVAGDEELLITLAQIIAEDAALILEKLETQLQERRLNEFAQSAHALKGLLSSFETGPPVKDLQSIIDAARQDDFQAVQALFRIVQPCLHTFVSQVGRLADG